MKLKVYIMGIELPFQKKPDFEYFRKVVMRETREGPVPLLEFEVDPEVMIEISGYDFPYSKIDVDLLARGSVDQVGKRTRQILEACAPGSGFCMVSGNSVTKFCKIENYMAFIDETRKWNEEH